MVSSGIKKLELTIENLFGSVAIWLKIGCCLDHNFLSRVSPSSLAPEYFSVIEKSIQGIEHSSISCRRRRLGTCKNVSRCTMRAANFSRGLAILLVHEEEEIALVELEREIIVHSVQIRHLTNDFRPTFSSKILRVEIPALSSILPTFENF